MREQQNPTTPDLHQPLLFAPSELLACGLRDAHHHPLVGVRSEDGVRSWRTSPATAWEHPLSNGHARPPATARSSSIAIRGRVKSSRVRSRRATAICRGPTLRRSVRRRGICISAGTCGHPCTAARRRDRGHSRPSAASRSTTRSRSARIVAMWASWPTTPSTVTTTPFYPRSEPYDLAELARALPAHWRRPARARTLVSALGRNCHLFAALCKLATRGSDEGLLTWARTLNREFSRPPARFGGVGPSGALCAATGHAGASKGTSRAGSSGRRREGGALVRSGEPGHR